MVLGERGTPSWVEENARRLRAGYYAAFGLAFLVTWVAPTLFGDQVLRTLVFYVILEAMAIFTSFALLIPWVKDQSGGEHETRGIWVPLVWVPMGTAMAFVTARAFGILWGMVPFLASLASLGGELIGTERGGERVQPVKFRLVATFLVFMLAGLAVMVLPTPALGITDAIVQEQGFDRMSISSDFFEQPETAMGWGGLYFLGLAAAQVYRLPEKLERWDTSDEMSG